MHGYPADDGLRQTFETLLADVASGRLQGIPTCTGLDNETEAALTQVVGATPGEVDELIRAARAKLEKWLDDRSLDSR